MSFAGDINRFTLKVETKSQAVFVGSATAFKNGWVEGSAITGAPALPVDTGNLRNGVQLEFPSATEALVSTNVEYAPYVEENVRNVTFHNGGPHGLALMIAGFSRVVDAVAAELAE